MTRFDPTHRKIVEDFGKFSLLAVRDLLAFALLTLFMIGLPIGLGVATP